MANKYTQSVDSSQTRFTQAPQGVIEYSRMKSTVTVDTDFNAGDIVPVYCMEVLPHDTFEIDLHEVIRQATVLTPTMDNMDIDVFAFFVPNRVVNESWKNVMGENSSGQWTAPQVSLVPLYAEQTAVQVPVCSVADYYGYPTQAPIPAVILQQCHDLKIRGYLEIYNSYFRDQNYQPPIPYSKLNLYNGFFIPVAQKSQYIRTIDIEEGQTADGFYNEGAVQKALFGDGSKAVTDYTVENGLSPFSALDKPLKANKLHDYFTSVLPSPQKGPSVVVSSLTPMPIITGARYETDSNVSVGVKSLDGTDLRYKLLTVAGTVSNQSLATASDAASQGATNGFVFNNLYADPANSSITLDDLRMSAAVQQVYEVLGRGGSRYREYISSFFGLDVDNPFDDIPTMLGHIRRELDLYQTAQTSQSTDQSAQGNLSAFGYTSKGGKLAKPYTFKEHGYVHILAVVRHKNVYSSLLTRDNFRLNMLDFYQYPLANISEQPVYTREINPFTAESDAVFGYQEAWAEYRFMPNMVTGHMRDGVQDSLSFWNYADPIDTQLEIADGEWLKSNSQEVLARSTAVTDTYAPQFKAKFWLTVDKQRPMPTYSVAGLDII